MSSKAKFLLLATGFIAAWGLVTPYAANAQKIELETPPLLWEAQPEKQPQNDAEYWKRKYNLKPKVSESIDEASDEKPSKTEDTKAETPLNKMGEGKDMDKYQITTKDNDSKSEAPDQAPVKKTEDRSGSVLIEEQNPPCDFKNVIGEDISILDFAIFEGRPVRVVYPQQNITRDVVAARINLKVGRDNKITKVACF